MFGLARIIGTPPGSIVIQTRNGRDVPNIQELPPDQDAIDNYDDLLRRHRQWEPRRPATGCYNCAGLVWASRRASILDGAAWIQIRDDDGYRRIDEGEAKCGDLVVYIDVNNGTSFAHVGLVVEFRPVLYGIGDPESVSCVPWVLSKFNSTSGEAIHRVRDVPFWGDGTDWRVEYWTDRP